MAKQLHWTQRPENKEKLRLLASKPRPGKRKRKGMSEEARANISAGLRAAARAKEQATEIVNGHAALPMTGRQIARSGVRTLAIEGAKIRLLALDREREVLMMFIKSGERTTKTEATETE